MLSLTYSEGRKPGLSEDRNQDGTRDRDRDCQNDRDRDGTRDRDQDCQNDRDHSGLPIDQQRALKPKNEQQKGRIKSGEKYRCTVDRRQAGYGWLCWPMVQSILSDCVEWAIMGEYD